VSFTVIPPTIYALEIIDMWYVHCTPVLDSTRF